jgi:DNA-binding transcriptional regulator YiaG
MSVFNRITSDFTPEVVMEHIAGSPSRMTGAALGAVRRGLGMSARELGRALHTSGHEITALEDNREAFIPEALDLAVRQVVLNR